MAHDMMTADDVQRIEIELADAKTAGLMGRTNRLARVLATSRALSALRETNRRLNRRVQAMEAGLAEKIEMARTEHRSLGRALANAGYAMLEGRCDQHEAAHAETVRALAELTVASERLRCDAQGFLDIAIKGEMDLRELRRQLTEKTEECDRLREDNTHLRTEKATIWSTINSPAEQP